MKSDRRVLMLGTYSIKRPRYGGRIRAKAIYDMYKSQFSSVRYVGIYPRSSASRRGRPDLCPSTYSEEQILLEPWLSDVLSGISISCDPLLRQGIARLLQTYRPDILQFEQPYAFLGVSDWLSSYASAARLVYSAHNVEHLLKRELYDSLPLSPSEKRHIVTFIREGELLLTRSAELVVAVSDSEAEYFVHQGAHRVTVAANGVTRRRPRAWYLERWRRYLRRHGIDQPILFVSSAHIPNWNGFLHLVGTKMGFLPSRSAIIMCGSVTQLAKRHQFDNPLEEATFWRRTYPIPSPSENDLAALLELASVILVPIHQGGGSNLKTAEALASERPLVVTPHGLRGFEKFTQFPNVFVAADPEEFKKAMRLALCTPATQLAPSQRDMLQSLYWESCLSDLPDAVRAL